MFRAIGGPSRRVSEARDRGFRGGRIAPHRAMIGIEVSWTLFVDLIVLPLIFVTIMLLLLDPLMSAWRTFFESIREPLGLPGLVATRIFEAGPFAVAVPYFTAQTTWPTARDLQGGWLAMATIVSVSLFMRGRMLPIAYFLRALAMLQLTAQLWFTMASPPFAYDLPTYLNGLLVCGVVILVLSPFLVAFTFHIFDFLLWQKLMMATMLLGHLSVFLPLQAAVHAFVIYKASLLALPLLFFAFGVLLDMFVYVALYGWGMSWRSGGVLDATDRRPPARIERFPINRSRPTPTPLSVRAITPPSSATFRLAWAGAIFRRLTVIERGGA